MTYFFFNKDNWKMLDHSGHFQNQQQYQGNYQFLPDQLRWQQFQQSPPLFRLPDGRTVSKVIYDAVAALGRKILESLPEEVEDAYSLTPAQFFAARTYLVGYSNPQHDPFGGIITYYWRGTRLIEVKGD